MYPTNRRIDNYQIALRPIVKNINLPIVIKTAIFPGEQHESLVVATQVGEILKINGRARKTIVDIRAKIGQLGLTPNITFDQRGLLGLEFHPDFQQNGLFYIYYASTKTKTGDLQSALVDPCSPTSLQQCWSNQNVYDHLNILEEWRYCYCQKCIGANQVNTLFILKQPFFDNNGTNNLTWDPELNILTLSTGDGGSNYDPFNLAQNNDYPYGKILAIRPQLISRNSQIPGISKLREMNSEQQDSIQILSQGLRDPYGVVLERWQGRYIRYTGNRGQSVKEFIYGYYDYRDSDGCGLNFGWRPWEGNWPTTTPTPCPRNNKETTIDQTIIDDELSNDLTNLPISDISAASTSNLSNQDRDLDQTKTHSFNWNLNTNYGPVFQINQGAAIHFISTDSLNHTLNLSSGPPDWFSMKQLVGVNNNLNFLTEPINQVGTIYFVCLIHQQTMRLAVFVNPRIELNDSQSLTSLPDLNSNQINCDCPSNQLVNNIACITFGSEAQIAAYLPCISYLHKDQRANHISGTMLTGLIPYQGHQLPGLSEAIIISEWNALSNGRWTQQGALLMARPDRFNLTKPVNYQSIKVVGQTNQPEYYVSLGSNKNQSRIFLGVYGSAGVSDLGLGIVYELVPVAKNC